MDAQYLFCVGAILPVVCFAQIYFPTELPDSGDSCNTIKVPCNNGNCDDKIVLEMEYEAGTSFGGGSEIAYYLFPGPSQLESAQKTGINDNIDNMLAFKKNDQSSWIYHALLCANGWGFTFNNLFDAMLQCCEKNNAKNEFGQFTMIGCQYQRAYQDFSDCYPGCTQTGSPYICPYIGSTNTQETQLFNSRLFTCSEKGSNTCVISPATSNQIATCGTYTQASTNLTGSWHEISNNPTQVCNDDKFVYCNSWSVKQTSSNTAGTTYSSRETLVDTIKDSFAQASLCYKK